MANTYFQFKQFIIQQDKCAMKVCTDSCLFGATLPLLNATNKPIINVLDIGTGTGLLSLMYAQLNKKAAINAIEIDNETFAQATENVTASALAKQIIVQQANILQWQTNVNFDLIICNPPFYENEWQSNNTMKNIAHHSTALTIKVLIETIYKLMQIQTVCCLLLPTKRWEAIKKIIVQENLFLAEEITIFANEKMNDFRTIVHLKKTATFTNTKTITISEKGDYTPNFINFLSAFYLKL
jgi:tRNA1Val (adenine37-N6)-methyltransferase